MANYKLKKWYPSLPKDWEIGMELGQGDRGKYSWYSPCNVRYCYGGISREEVENYSEFWQEVVEKDYEILSFSKNLSTEVVKVSKIDLALSVEEFFKNVCWSIHSVKRLSDGEVFTIGDKINHYAEYKKDEFSTKEWIILRIYFIEPNRLAFYVGKGLNLGIKNISKGKQPLFTTEDGVEIFEGDEYEVVNKNTFFTHSCTCDKYSNIKEKDFIKFSTKEAAKEYILMNNPCLSISEIIEEGRKEFKRRGKNPDLEINWKFVDKLKNIVNGKSS